MDDVLHVRPRRRPSSSGLRVAYTASVVASLSAGPSDRPPATVRDPACPHADVLVAAHYCDLRLASRDGFWGEALRRGRLGALLFRRSGDDRHPDRATDLDDARHGTHRDLS